MKVIAVVGRLRAPDLPRCLQKVHDIAKDRAVFSRDLKGLLPDGVKIVENQRLREEADVFLALGGDGTFLRTARWADGKPVAGVNLGHLGFLTVYSVEELEQLLQRLLGNDYTVEERMRLQVEHNSDFDRALNDVCLSATSARTLHIEVFVDGEPTMKYRGDGLIISTPTGSTAYNLAAGGPILYPSSGVMVITPICAHSLGIRPLVVPRETVLQVKVESRGEPMVLSADGRQSFLLEPKDEFVVKENPTVARFVRTDFAPDFFEVLSKKLEWG